MKHKHYEHEQRPVEPAAWPEQAVPAWTHPSSRSYLLSRGISQQECEFYDLHYVEAGEWRSRLLIPIYDDAGSLVCFQGRTVVPDVRPKYRTSGPRHLYRPWDEPHGSVLCLVEGPFDLYPVQRVTPAVAMLGVNPSEEQMGELKTLIASYPWSSVAIWYDPDALGNSYLIQSLLLPESPVPVEVIVYPETKDPGECSREQILDAIGYLFPPLS